MYETTSLSDTNDPTNVATSRFNRMEIARLTLFEQGDLDVIEPLLSNAPIRFLEAGETLTRVGDRYRTLFLVVSGRLQAKDPNTLTPDVVIKAGDSWGESFLLQDIVATRAIVAIEPSRILVIDTETAWKLINASHAVARNLLALVVERARSGGDLEAGETLRITYNRHATLDEGTGLHNRAWLDGILPRQVARSTMNGASLGLLLIEIDNRAEYETALGAVAMDHAQYAVAQTLNHCIRPTDLIAHYGKARFAVVLPDADLVGTCAVGERINAAVSETIVLMSDESILPSVTVSIGAAQLELGMNASALLNTAECSLEMAKETGGNRVCS